MLRRLGASGLTEYERAELRDMGPIYWAGETASKPRATLLPGDSNHGYDDERGDYHVVLHDHLNYRYEVLGLVGRGAFGQVCAPWVPHIAPVCLGVAPTGLDCPPSASYWIHRPLIASWRRGGEAPSSRLCAPLTISCSGLWRSR